MSNGEKSVALMEVLKKDPPGEDASDRVIVELQQRVPYESSTIENYLKNLNDKGAWSDINYKDKTRSGLGTAHTCRKNSGIDKTIHQF